MDVRFHDGDLERLERDLRFTGGFPPEVATMFRRRLEQIRQAPDERDFRNMRSFRFEKLQGTRRGQHSIRLNDQWRIVLEIEGAGPGKILTIVAIEDYH